jgi:hypothetical protein
MRYLSPAFLFGASLQPPYDKKAVQRERKKLLADLELSGTEGLELNGRYLNKNEIIDYFEELQKETVSDYHAAIAEDPVLFTFLQDGKIYEWTWFKDAAIYNDPGFIGWLSPYFYTAFTDYVAACFENTDATAMNNLLRNQLLATEEDKERCWTSIANILNKNIALFDHYHGRGALHRPKPMRIDNLTAYLGHGYIEVIKQLPDNRFAQLKNNYAFSIQHPAISAFNRDGDMRAVTITWLKDAQDLAVSEEIQATIGAKLDELNQLLRRGGKRSTKPWNYVWIAFVLIRIITLFTGKSSGDNDTPTNVQNIINPDNKSFFKTPKAPTHADTAYVDSLFHGKTH